MMMNCFSRTVLRRMALSFTLREQCSYSKFFGPYFPTFGLNTKRYLSVFSPNAGKYGSEKFLIRTLFTQSYFQWGSLLEVLAIANLPLRKISKVHIISSCGNVVESHSLRRVSGNSLETLWTLCLSTKFPHQEIWWNFVILRNTHRQ